MVLRAHGKRDRFLHIVLRLLCEEGITINGPGGKRQWKVFHICFFQVLIGCAVFSDYA